MTRYSHADLVRYDALAALNLPARIERALEQLAHATSPLHGTSNDTARGGGSSSTVPAGIDPNTGERSTELRRSSAVRRELYTAIDAFHDAVADMYRIVDEWAPLPQKGGMGDTENTNLWCPNCLKHGVKEPRGIDGSRHCRWCCDIKRNYGRYPNAELIKTHVRGHTISDNEYRRQLGKGAA